MYLPSSGPLPSRGRWYDDLADFPPSLPLLLTFFYVGLFVLGRLFSSLVCLYLSYLLGMVDLSLSDHFW